MIKFTPADKRRIRKEARRARRERATGPWGRCDWCSEPIWGGKYKYNGSYLCCDCYVRAVMNEVNGSGKKEAAV
jgi:hypothetical protein